ncbi:Uncharacterised protein [Mycobacteroides abscessus subsp. abscessus]|nr:Uncharacterised protein [Mycobacteroides abscessus subsp. abscessus]
MGSKPYGSKASQNFFSDAVDTGSDPLMIEWMFDRSSGGSPSLGTPRNAQCSKAKFGSAEKLPPRSSPLTAISRNQRSGRRINAAGLITVMCLPSIDGTITVIKPMSWKNGSQVQPRSASCPCAPSCADSASISCSRLVATLR